jgi:nucleoside-diphosphate-sugar epimerase
MNKNILVTGGAGFIGSEITKYLVNKKFKVTVFDNNSRGKPERLKTVWKKIKFIKGDIRNKKEVYYATKNVNSIIHLAYVNGTKFFYSKPYEILEIAIKGMINLLDACKISKIKEFYLASSSEVYQTPSKIPTDEKEMLKIPDIFNPRYSYGGGKIISELLGLHFTKKNKFKKFIIFRPHNVYSGDMGKEHVIPEFIERIKNIKKDKKFLIHGTGNEKRSFIHIDDFINAFDKVFHKGKNQEIYNIGTTEVIKIKDLAKKVAKIYSVKIKLKSTKLNVGGTNIRCPDITKIKKLGFKAKINIDEGLKKITSKL